MRCVRQGFRKNNGLFNGFGNTMYQYNYIMELEDDDMKKLLDEINTSVKVESESDIKKINENTTYVKWNINKPIIDFPDSVKRLYVGKKFQGKMIVSPNIDFFHIGERDDMLKQIIVPKGVKIYRGLSKDERFFIVAKNNKNYYKMTDDEKLTFLIENNATDFNDEIIELFNKKLNPNQENLYLSIKNKNDKHFDLCLGYGCVIDKTAFEIACKKKHKHALKECLKRGFQIEEYIELL